TDVSSSLPSLSDSHPLSVASSAEPTPASLGAPTPPPDATPCARAAPPPNSVALSANEPTSDAFSPRPPSDFTRSAASPHRPAQPRSLIGPSICGPTHPVRSEEHTSELQSRENLVCRLLLEKTT